MTDVAVLSTGRAAQARPVTPSTILAAELADLCRELGAVPGVDPVLAQRLRRARDLAAGLDPYLDQCTTPESPALAELAHRTRETDWESAPGEVRLEQEMLSGHVEGQVLKFLVHLAGATRVLEIGMFTGYSALAMAEALPDDGVLVACEIDPVVASFAQESFDASPAGRKIAIEVGPAIDTLRRLAAAGREFDFVFVDADKPGYLDYVEFLLGSTLLAPRAVIAVDNTLMQGEPYADVDISRNGAAISGFNAALTYDPRVEQVLIPLRDGLTLIRRTPR
ncbi:O-methyltransferase [Mycobacterium antarcticum]|uniref:O-methyltransferase n=1 Tax=unclassified Mycolicibacterium TaxID=2636767 RepID=UPI0023862DB0|nr:MULTISPECIES: class I SAM-dependent methyltransferase [unclassified Mycolicibacterium]GLP78171.1 O-methyltransferase [Mycolicibacterium sp. TUM20983]GLP81222.1 O-methyltransferase [Mycolicibacterium sp. TUM20984]